MEETVEKSDVTEQKPAVDQELAPENLKSDVIEINKKKKKRKSGIVVDANAASDNGISDEIKLSQSNPELLILKGVPTPRLSETPSVLSPKEPNEVVIKLKHKGQVETKKFDLDFTGIVGIKQV